MAPVGARVGDTFDQRDHAWRLLFPVGAHVVSEVEEVVAGNGGPVPIVGLARGSWAGSQASLASLAGMCLVQPTGDAPLRLRRAGFDHQLAFVVLPSSGDPRWLVPEGGAGLTAGALRLYTPYLGRARVASALARAAGRLGLLRRLRPRLLLARREPFPLVEHLCGLLGPVSVVVHVGRAGREERLTVGALAPDGRLRGVARIARSVGGRASIAREAAMLRALAGRDDLGAPRLLSELAIEGAHVTVLSPIPGRAPQARLGSAHRDFLAAAAGGPLRPGAEAALVADLRARAETAGGSHAVLAEAASFVSGRLADASLPRTVVHGDFAPWNLRLDGDRLGAFDWEHGTLDGLPLQDELHHELQVGFLLRAWGVDDALGWLSTAAAGRDLSMRQALVSLALAERLARALEEAAPTEVVARERALLGGYLATGMRT